MARYSGNEWGQAFMCILMMIKMYKIIDKLQLLLSAELNIEPGPLL